MNPGALWKTAVTVETLPKAHLKTAPLGANRSDILLFHRLPNHPVIPLGT